MVSPRDLETVESQRQFLQNPLVVLVLGSRVQIHDAFDVLKPEKCRR